MLKINRIALGLCIQFITGHNGLLRHKRYYLENPNMDLTCRLCNEPNSTEDSSHLWSECRTLRAQRNKVLAKSIRSKKLKPSSGLVGSRHNPAPVKTWCEVTQAKMNCSGVMLTQKLSSYNYKIFIWIRWEIWKFQPSLQRHLDIASPRLYL